MMERLSNLRFEEGLALVFILVAAVTVLGLLVYRRKRRSMKSDKIVLRVAGSGEGPQETVNASGEG